MKREYRLIKAFGKNKAGMADITGKVSGVKITRIIMGDDIGCSFCFPHGHDTINSSISNRQHNWKKQRKNQWRLT